MDRSSFHFVESTRDVEKRQDYKAQLASRLAFSQPKEPSPMDTSFNGVNPGGKLVHPSLGEGTLIEVDHDRNEVLIDFGDKGIIGLVLSQAKSFVHAPIKEVVTKGIAGKDDPFFGSEIQSRMLAPQDRAFREVDLTRIISPDFIDPEKKFIPEGSTVWHPDLGACTILSVDEKSNSVTLSTSSDAVIDMVLSQVRSKLRIIETSPEHVPMRPLVLESLPERVPQYKSRGDVSVSIPEVFKTWQRSQQFMFLTRSQHLTTDQANDVFSVLDGSKPMFHTVTVSWQSKEETEANIIPGPEPISIKTATRAPSILQEQNLWHPDFGVCSVASVDEKNNELILQTSVGLMPFVMSTTVPKLAVLTGKAPEHSPKSLGTRVFATPAPPVKDQPKVPVILPEEFATWKTSDQYIFLTKTALLTPEHANDVIARGR